MFDFSGTIAFQELMETGGTEEKRELHKLQNELQIDDPINIQFTSVSIVALNFPFKLTVSLENLLHAGS